MPLVVSLAAARVVEHQNKYGQPDSCEEELANLLAKERGLRSYEDSMARRLNIHDNVHEAAGITRREFREAGDIHRLLAPQGPNPHPRFSHDSLREVLDINALRESCNTVVDAIELKESSSELRTSSFSKGVFFL